MGASMGGMIAQTMAIRRPERVRSLTSVMSTTGDRRKGLPSCAWTVLMRRAPTTRDAYIESFVRTFRLIGSPAFPMDEARSGSSPARPSTADTTRRDRAPAGGDRGIRTARRACASCVCRPP